MRAIAMRRMKTTIVDGKPLVDLPKKTVQLETLEFSKEERKVYDTMQKDGRIIISRSDILFMLKLQNMKSILNAIV